MSGSDRRRGDPVIFLLITLAGWIGWRLHQGQTAEAAIESGPVGTFMLATAKKPESRCPQQPAGLLRLAKPATGKQRSVGGEGVRLMVRPEKMSAPAFDVVEDAQPGTTAGLGAATGNQTPGAGSDKPSRWSFDGWILVRRGGGPSSLAASGGSYGASQMGAVLRYDLLPGTDLQARAYVRLTSALAKSAGQEAAVGLSARPVAQLPVRVNAELRLSRASSLGARSAVFIEGGVGRLQFPFEVNGEFYGQAGYVAGNFASGFIDGQARLAKVLLHPGRGSLSLGAGIWGGAQRDAARLDTGPTLALAGTIARGVRIRATAEWRLRIAGGASPGSGPALTLSAGF